MKLFHHEVYHHKWVEIEGREVVKVEVYSISMNKIGDMDLVGGVPSIVLLEEIHTITILATDSGELSWFYN